MSLTISIITPSYNQGTYIERTIQSVLSQNITSLDYLVMDGGSTDQTLQILQQYQNVLRFQSEKDRGQAHAVNKAISQTSGDIIGWLNSDDIYYPHALKKVMHFFQTHPQMDVLYGDANHIDDQDQILERYNTEPFSLEKLYEVCFISQPALFFRRRVVEKCGLLNETLQYCMDYEYWLRLAKKGIRFHYVPILLAGSRLHPQTKTKAFPIQVHKEINDMFKKHLQRVPNRWLINYAHVVANAHSNALSTTKKRRIIAIESFLAAIYWNKSIRWDYLCLITKWFISSFKKENFCL